MAIASPGATLRDEQQVIGSMVELMKKEQQFLVDADADGLSNLTPLKQQLTQQATLLARTRHRSLGLAGFPAGEVGMEPWLAVAGNADVRAQWNDLLQLTRDAKELNRVNGMLINRQLGNTNNLLNALRGPVVNPAGVYGPGGQTMAGGASRRFVVG